VTAREKRWFNLGGIGIEVDARTLPEVDTALAERLAELAVAPPSLPPPSITIVYRVVDRIEPLQRSGRQIYSSESGEARYDDDADRLDVVALDRDGRASCDLAHGVVEITTVRGDDIWLLTRPLLSVPLIELLKRRGLYSIHASAVATSRGCMILAGTSGSGKTTLALALAAAGQKLMSDDFVFATANDKPLEIVGFPEQPDLTDDTAAMLALDGSAAASADWPKRRVDVRRAAPNGLQLRSIPRWLVFPEVDTHRELSVLEPMQPAEAVAELAPNVLLTSTRTTQLHLDALSRLAESTTSHRLRAGRDLAATCGLLGDLAGEPE
jgi:hypothetical protein